MRITRKLAVLVAVPLVAAVTFAGLAVVTSAGSTLRAEQLRHFVAAGAAAGELAHALRIERAAAVLALTARTDDARQAFTGSLRATRHATDAWQRERARLEGLPDSTTALLERAGTQLAQLDGVRDQVSDRRGAASAVAFTYRIVIADLLAFRESLPQAGAAPADIADQLRAAAALSQATEHIGRQQVAVLRALAHGSITPAAAQEITAARTGHVDAGLTFESLAGQRWRQWWEQSATGTEALAARRMEDQVARTPAGHALALDAGTWTQALDARMRRLREVEARVDTEIVERVVALRDAQRQLTIGQSVAVTAAVAIAIGLAVGLGRPVVRGLRRLRDAAHRVAYDELPAVVSHLDDHEALGGLTPDEFAERATPPVPLTGRDELAEVGAAFHAVHQEALRTAAAQALLRVHIAAMFVNLARRGQTLAGRLTTALDEAERDEHDPQRLARLFEVDLLVTLLGRTNDSLLVLGGASPAQVRTSDEPLSAVLAAAQSQVEDYPRVEIGVVDTGVVIRAAAVDDVVKLLAELLDNGCSYSPPDTMVHADARWLSDRVVVQVRDEGIGITAARRAELNARLASRPRLDLAAVRAMGLTVVGHIAARHDIRVELRAGHLSGTVAEVTLPPPVFRLATVPTGPAAPEPEPVRSVPGVGPEAATQELHLPVYEQVRSRWFLTGHETATGVPGAAPAASREGGWRTAADAGWSAAARAAEPEVTDTTRTGLPKRRPGAQLVPGGVDEPAIAGADAGAGSGAGTGTGAGAGTGDWRDPAKVSAALAAYSRGLAAGRARHQHATATAQRRTP